MLPRQAVASLPKCQALPPLPPNITSYSPDFPFPNCTNLYDFQFTSLDNITKEIFNAWPQDPRLQANATGIETAALTSEACLVIAGRGPTKYPNADIWARLTTWKFPLLQLISQFSLAPLGRCIEAFALARLLGNPIGTFMDLILTLANGQARALFWKGVFGSQNQLSGCIQLTDVPCGTVHTDEAVLFAQRERTWKALALLIISCDQWGRHEGTKMQNMITKQLLRFKPSVDGPLSPETTEKKQKFLQICLDTADALAADCSTKFLPVYVSLSFFVGSVGIAFGRTKAVGPENPTTFINVEAYGIAFSATYFWLISTVIVASMLGASQTEDAIPRILEQFVQDIQPHCDITSSPDQECLNFFADLRHNSTRRHDRWTKGGVSSWHPVWEHSCYIKDKASEIESEIKRYGNESPKAASISPFSLPGLLLRVRPGSCWFPIFNCFIGCLTGIIIAYLVPPTEWSCREWSILIMFLWWFLNWTLDFAITTKNIHWRVGLHWLKDSISALFAFAMIIATQFGIFNMCACYTGFGRHALVLPEMQAVAATLVTRIGVMYPGLAFACIAYQLVIIPSLIIYQYFESVQVSLQRDDRGSNLALAQTWRRTKSLREVYKTLPSVVGGWFRKAPQRQSSVPQPRLPTPGPMSPFDMELRHTSRGRASSAAPLVMQAAPLGESDAVEERENGLRLYQSASSEIVWAEDDSLYAEPGVMSAGSAHATGVEVNSSVDADRPARRSTPYDA